MSKFLAILAVGAALIAIPVVAAAATDGEAESCCPCCCDPE